MKKNAPHRELDELLELFADAPQGLAVEQVATRLGPALSRRTLQRRLALLVHEGRLRPQGKGRGARYLAIRPQVFHAQEPEAVYGVAPRETLIPMSAESLALQAAIRRPISQRKPVGYQLGFLEQYHPNASFYLPASLREQLHSLGRPPVAPTAAGTFAKDILDRLLIDLSWASSRLEGNTYSRLDTEKLIALGQAAEGKDAVETQMILNHKDAIEFLVQDPERAALSPATVIALHALLADGLMADPAAVGRIRQRAVGIGGSVYQPLAHPQQLEELFGIVVQMAMDIEDPFEQAFFLMVHLPYLQPFEDVNKRVSRLAANIPFIRHNLCPLSFLDLPQQAYVDGLMAVYELNRVELLRDVFVWAYARACQQYVAVRREMVPPDLFRLRHRKALGALVAKVVRSGRPAQEAVLREQAPGLVPAEDMERFIALAKTEFASLHEGNAVRFGLRPLEFAAWLTSSRR